MADIVNIIACNSYSTGKCYISCFDSTITVPGLVIGAEPVPIVANLIESGFQLFQYDGDGNSTAYLLIRTGVQPVTCNPLAPFAGRVGTTVTVTTGAGTESGILQLIGEDVVQILEPSGDILLIPADSVEAVI